MMKSMLKSWVKTIVKIKWTYSLSKYDVNFCSLTKAQDRPDPIHSYFCQSIERVVYACFFSKQTNSFPMLRPFEYLRPHNTRAPVNICRTRLWCSSIKWCSVSCRFSFCVYYFSFSYDLVILIILFDHAYFIRVKLSFINLLKNLQLKCFALSYIEMPKCTKCVLRTLSILQLLCDCDCQLDQNSINFCSWIIEKEMVIPRPSFTLTFQLSEPWKVIFVPIVVIVMCWCITDRLVLLLEFSVVGAANVCGRRTLPNCISMYT